MKKIFAVISLILCTALLCGCMAIESTTTIRANGTVTVRAFAGYTEDGLLLMAQMSEQENPEEVVAQSMATSETMVRNGETYYGVWEESSYESVAQYNEANVSEENPDAINVLEQHDDGSFTLTKVISPGEAADAAQGAAGDSGEVDESILSEMYMMNIYTFPEKVKQIEGPEGIFEISGKTIQYDATALDSLNGPTKFVFTTKGAAPSVTFVDVKKGSWYYDAVMALADSGLVNGVGDNRFDPEGTLTYAQFCQIVLRASGIEPAEENGYWAGKAIRMNIEAGSILSRGEITPENYDVPITREAAISAMFYLQYETEDFVSKLTHDELIEHIPDYDSISEAYRNNIIGAYGAGITTGIDENHTFNPMGQLKRAEICQLFYNSDWTAPTK